MTHLSYVPLSTSPTRKNEQPGAQLEVPPIGKVLLTMILQGYTSSATLQEVPEWCVELSVNKDQIVLPHSAIIDKAGGRLGRGGNVAEIGAIDIRATFHATYL